MTIVERFAYPVGSDEELKSLLLSTSAKNILERKKELPDLQIMRNYFTYENGLTSFPVFDGIQMMLHQYERCFIVECELSIELEHPDKIVTANYRESNKFS
jgi:hypothetical protein